MELTKLTARELSALYRNRTASPCEAVSEILDLAEKLQPNINAFCWLDRELAMAEARESEDRWMQGKPKSPLDGVPISVKDNIHVRGMPTRFGSRTLQAANPSTADSPAVERLREGGAVLFGKTCLPDFAHKIVTDSPLTGLSRNPYNLAHTPGGSSGGAAAAVASGIGPLALGTDGGGSIRIPAAFTGTFGFKPTFGRVPHYPRGPFALLSHVGPIARSTQDAATMMSIITRPDARDWYSLPFQGLKYEKLLRKQLKSVRVAVSETLGIPDLNLQNEIRSALAAAVKHFEALGASVEWSDPPAVERCNEIHGTIWAACSAALARSLGEFRHCLDPSLLELIHSGEQIDATTLLSSITARGELGNEIRAFFEHFDLILCPVYPTVAPHFDDFEALEPPIPKLTAWCNELGLPAASVCCGMSSDGLPIGLQIVGPQYADEAVMTASFAFEQIQGGAPRAL